MTNRLLGGLLAAAAAGCSPGLPPVSQLAGRVTVDGKPQPFGRVIVAAADGSTLTSSEIEPDGTYAVRGAPVGPVRVGVQVEAYRNRPTRANPGAAAPPPAAPKAKGAGSAGHVPAGVNPAATAAARRPPLIPPRFESPATSGLETTVGPGPTTFDIELASK